MISRIFVFTSVCLLSSCAYFKKISEGSSAKSSKVATLEKGPGQSKKTQREKKYLLKDNTGKYYVFRESGLSKNGKSYITKERVESEDGTVLEKKIVFSRSGKLKKYKMNVLMPEMSQFSVWFEKKKYFVSTKADYNSGNIYIKMKSPESQWNGHREFSFPKNGKLFCYFSQIIDCVGKTSFLKKAIASKAGKANLHILWEGYPYFGEQFLNIPDELFSNAEFSYDGKNAKGEYRFSLSFGRQAIFYFLDRALELKKIFWVSQGFSLVRI